MIPCVMHRSICFFQLLNPNMIKDIFLYPPRSWRGQNSSKNELFSYCLMALCEAPAANFRKELLGYFCKNVPVRRSFRNFPRSSFHLTWRIYSHTEPRVGLSLLYFRRSAFSILIIQIYGKAEFRGKLSREYQNTRFPRKIDFFGKMKNDKKN